MSHFDVNVQYTAGKNFPLTDYLSRHPIVSTEITELDNKADGLDEAEAGEEFVINQIYGLLEFNQKLGSIKRFTERSITKENFDQSQSDNNTHERNQNNHLRKPHRCQTTLFQICSKLYRHRTTKWTRSTELIWNLSTKKGAIPLKPNACGYKETTSLNWIKPVSWGRKKKAKGSKNIDQIKRAASESRN